MSLLLRITIVGCDRCPKESEIIHEVSYGDTASFSNALTGAGWENPYSSKENGYIHLCPECSKKENNEQG